MFPFGSPLLQPFCLPGIQPRITVSLPTLCRKQRGQREGRARALDLIPHLSSSFTNYLWDLFLNLWETQFPPLQLGTESPSLRQATGGDGQKCTESPQQRVWPMQSPKKLLLFVNRNFFAGEIIHLACCHPGGTSQIFTTDPSTHRVHGSACLVQPWFAVLNYCW